MTIQRNGNKVTGTYKWNNGRIEGTISGHTVTGWWYQSNGKGKFVFDFNSDFSALTPTSRPSLANGVATMPHRQGSGTAKGNSLIVNGLLYILIKCQTTIDLSQHRYDY